ncbi:energy transducer TonB [Paraurantiacibacter namhicola]|uniref:energy transducer TonB n=1 Tax=Paraurantiacibacter namhicola TaxID=645517 RepID=UPI00147091E7|nr:energy transducer TonB [Paraurantiacibacter namhicola]
MAVAFVLPAAAQDEGVTLSVEEVVTYEPVGPDTPGRPATPKTSPGSWLTADDYPVEARRDGREGNVSFMLQVGPDGRPIGCTVTESSGSADLDAAACDALMQRARFDPARDDAGKPIASTYRNRIMWKLDTRDLPEPTVIETYLIVGTNGEVEECGVTKAEGGFGPRARMFCETAGQARYVQQRDEDGNPVRMRVTTRVQVTHEVVE